MTVKENILVSTEIFFYANKELGKFNFDTKKLQNHQMLFHERILFARKKFPRQKV